MWQRIQTVFLVVVVVCMIVGIFLPIAVVTDPATHATHELYPLHYTIKENGQTVTTTYFPYSVTAMLMIAAATLAGMSITRYENRMAQVKMGTLNALILAGAMISIVVFFTQLTKKFQSVGLGLVIWIAFTAALCNWLALRFIRRDEKLVRDSDRLR
jgi:ABC-type Fe3+-siderophore transport system permease subunit